MKFVSKATEKASSWEQAACHLTRLIPFWSYSWFKICSHTQTFTSLIYNIICVHSYNINVLLTTASHNDTLRRIAKTRQNCWKSSDDGERLFFLLPYFCSTNVSEGGKMKNFITHSYCGIMNSFSNCFLLPCYYCSKRASCWWYTRLVLCASNSITTFQNMVAGSRGMSERDTRMNLHVTIICVWQLQPFEEPPT